MAPRTGAGSAFERELPAETEEVFEASPGDTAQEPGLTVSTGRSSRSLDRLKTLSVASGSAMTGMILRLPRFCATAVLFVAAAASLSCTTQKGDDTKLSKGELAVRQQSYAKEAYPVRVVDRTKFSARLRPATVAAPTGYPARSIVVVTRQKLLYFIRGDGTADRYGIAVGASGYSWKGNAVVGRKAVWPAWYPTDDMKRNVEGLPPRIAPGPDNPLGARALYLFQGGRDTLYRIHGTSEPWTIGTEASSGCIRMLNEDVIDLYEKAANGTTVVVM